MSRVTFIYPSVGWFSTTRYVRSWQMQPLSIGVLAALTPKEWEKIFYDDRLEPIDYDQPTDLVAISIETFTARRGYQIADEYRRRGIPVVLGGYHATFCTEEAQQHADAVCVGEAENVWGKVLQDAPSQLSEVYSHPQSHDLRGVTPDRSIFQGKNYFKIILVETSRGCHFRCNFCSITAFYKNTYRRRSISEIVNEIQQIKGRTVFFVDDNIISDTNNAVELFQAIKPLRIQWISQASINLIKDIKLLDLMAESGCIGLLVGFESLNPDNLAYMGKTVNQAIDYEKAIRAFRERGILLYGTFLFGLRHDSPQLIDDTVRFANRQKLFLCAFNHIIPFPGTPLYQTYKAEDRLMYDRWWLNQTYRFGQAPFYPENFSPTQLEDCCFQARRQFYRLGSILHRSLDLSANCASPKATALFFYLNLLMRRELTEKFGLPLGVQESQKTQVHRLKGGLAQPSDDARLRDFLCKMSMPGAIKVAYLREPRFFQALQVEGRHNDVVIGRDQNTGHIVGFGTRSIKTAFINGHSSPLGYLSSLRLLKDYQRGIYLARGYQLFKNLHGDGRTKLYITTILESNRVAQRLLTSGRAGLPSYYDYGRFRCLAISLKHNIKNNNTDGLEIRPARDEDVSAIIDFWQRYGRRKQFFPEYKATDIIKEDGLLRDLSIGDIWLAWRDGQLVGTTAAWNQQSFRQSWVTGYSRSLTLIRPAYNAIAKLLDYPIIPKKGGKLDYINLSLICIHDDDKNIFATILAQLMSHYQGRYQILLAGLHERDLLQPVLEGYHHFSYDSRLYVVCWENGESSFKKLDGRVPYVELGSL